MSTPIFTLGDAIFPNGLGAKLYNFRRMTTTIEAKPFLKWAGGKRQLLEQFKKRFPKELSKQGTIKYFYEPFLGSGAVFFWVAQHCAIKKAFLNELNPEIYLCYIAIKKDVEAVIANLKEYNAQYKSSTDKDREELYYEVREEYNSSREHTNFKKYNAQSSPKRAAMTIFLNRTCFNGLYRVNSKGKFNVPFGRYHSPLICDTENLKNVSKLLQNVEISNDDFSVVKAKLKEDSFVYFDPPYKPVSETAKFTAYSADSFGDKDQERLAKLVRQIDPKAKIMLSNSAPKSDYFEKLYSGFRIEKISATRLINCVAEKRGKVNEILVMNYDK